MALDRFRSPRVASISPTSAANDFRSAAAKPFKAAQNSGSSESDVRWPAMVSERLRSRVTLVTVKAFVGEVLLGRIQGFFCLAAAELQAVFFRLFFCVSPRFVLAGQAQVDDLAGQAGPSMFSGRTMASKSAALMPSFNASSRKVVPFLWAVLAILAALS